MPLRRDHRHIAQYGGHGTGAPPFAPTDISGLSAWYDFTDSATLFTDTGLTTPVTADADVIKGVTDKSGVGNHLTEATNGPAYKLNIVNGKSVARFDGTNDLLTKNPLVGTIAQPYTAFLVMKWIDITTNNDPAMDGAAGGRSHPIIISNASGAMKWSSFYGTGIINGSVAPDTNTHVFCATATGATSTLRVDGGANVISGNPGTNSLASLTLANNTLAGGSAFGNFNFVHLMIYNTDLSSANKDTVGSYLSTSAGTTWTAVS